VDKTPTLNEKFHTIHMVSKAFNIMTHRELAIIPREFHHHETIFFSIFLKTGHIIKNAYVAVY
jgi:hypothetical protein